MGLETVSEFVTLSGLTAPAGSYISISGHSLELNRVSDGNYTLRFIATTWKSMDRSGGFRSIQSQSYTVPIVDADMAINMYTTAYNHLKTIYIAARDVV